MAFLKTKGANGRPVKFASAKARDRLIKDMLRAQKRLLDGKTLSSGTPSDFDGLSLHTTQMSPDWREGSIRNARIASNPSAVRKMKV